MRLQKILSALIIAVTALSHELVVEKKSWKDFSQMLMDKHRVDFEQWQQQLDSPATQGCLSQYAPVFPKNCLVDQLSKDVIALGITICHKKRFGREYLSSKKDGVCDVEFYERELREIVHKGRLENVEFLKSSVQECMQGLNSEGYADWRQWYTHIDSICFYLSSNSWQRDTETRMNAVSSLLGDARQFLMENYEVHQILMQQQKETAQLHDHIKNSSAEMEKNLINVETRVRTQFEYLQETASTSQKFFDDKFHQIIVLWETANTWHQNVISEFFYIHSFFFYFLFALFALILTSPISTRSCRVSLFLTIIALLFAEFALIKISSHQTFQNKFIKKSIRIFAILFSLFKVLRAHYKYVDPTELTVRLHRELLMRISQLDGKREEERNKEIGGREAGRRGEIEDKPEEGDVKYLLYNNAKDGERDSDTSDSDYVPSKKLEKIVARTRQRTMKIHQKQINKKKTLWHQIFNHNDDSTECEPSPLEKIQNKRATTANGFDPMNIESWRRLNGDETPNFNSCLLTETAHDFLNKIKISRLQKICNYAVHQKLTNPSESAKDNFANNGEQLNKIQSDPIEINFIGLRKDSLESLH